MLELKVYDSVWHDGIVFKLIKFGFPMHIVNIINKCILQRTFSVRINSFLSTSRPIEAGVPQGSIISPLLLNLSYIPLPKNASLALYADDTTVVYRSQNSDIYVAAYSLQSSIDFLINWVFQWTFKFTQYNLKQMYFLWKKNIVHSRNPNLWTLFYHEPEDQALKYLGVWLDKKLNWNFHANKKLTQYSVIINKLMTLNFSH